ncbi:unnamed protein product, partial [Prorocentrum cordatum]
MVAGSVLLVEPDAFTRLSDQLHAELDEKRRRQIQASIDATGNERRQNRLRGRAQKLNKAAQLLSPFDKRVSLSGIRVQGQTMQEPSQVLQGLTDYWKPVFTGKDFDDSRARDFLGAHAPQVTCSDLPPPTFKFLQDFLRRQEDSGPGPDRLRHAAWARAPRGAGILFDGLQWILQGSTSSWNFNELLGVFIPKGTEANDAEGVFRDVGDAKPLGLKNTDCTILIGVCCFELSRRVPAGPDSNQRGCVLGRNFCSNIVGLDAYSRVYSMGPQASPPLLVGFDFGQAFPSLCQRWLALVLDVLDLPPPLRWFFDA